MELKEYLQIIKKNLRLFIAIIIVIILASFSYFYLTPAVWDTSLTLNISRIGVQNTDQYKFDDFYRIQADEKFAETIVQWLGSPVIVTEIYKKAGIDTQKLSLRQLRKGIKAEKLSSQIVSVSLASASPQEGEKIAAAVSSVLSENTLELNKDQKEDTWFEIISEKPIIIKYAPSPILVFLGSLLLGVFLSFWLVMIKHYVS